MTPTSLAVTPTSLAVTPTSLAVTPSSLAVTPTSLAVTPSSLAVNPTSLAVTPSSLVVNPSLNRPILYLCFLKMWKALSLLKLDLLSVAGWKGTEWMKGETVGETWRRETESYTKTPDTSCPHCHDQKLAASTLPNHPTMIRT